MIRSDKLEKFFGEQQLPYEKLYSLLRSFFGVTYVKTFSNCGCYTWFGGTDPEVDTGRDAPFCVIKNEYDHTCPITNEKIEGNDCLVFLRHTEDQVIHKFIKYNKLKVFL